MADAGYEEAFIILADDNGTDRVRTKHAGRITPEQSLDIEQWTIFADGVQKVARSVRKEVGLRCVFHHHCGGFVETPAEVDRLMSLTDPELLGLCLDMGHYRFGGGDPLNALKSLGKRVWHVHFKDCEPVIAQSSRQQDWDYFESVRRGVFCPLGKGEVDFPSIVKELKRLKYTDWIVVEQDVLPGMGDPKSCALENRRFLKGMGL
jgi:inosose dehydratase